MEAIANETKIHLKMMDETWKNSNKNSSKNERHPHVSDGMNDDPSELENGNNARHPRTAGILSRQHFRKNNGNLGTKWKNRKIKRKEKQKKISLDPKMESSDDQSDQSESDQWRNN